MHSTSPFVMAAKATIHGKSDVFVAAMLPVRYQRIAMRGFPAKEPCVYILASAPNGVLYVGVTSELATRVGVHKQDLHEGFTKRYAVHRLVYYEMHETMDAAIRRETQIKKWKRAWKVRLINEMNPEWCDLFDETWGVVEEGPADRERLRR